MDQIHLQPFRSNEPPPRPSAYRNGEENSGEEEENKGFLPVKEVERREGTKGKGDEGKEGATAPRESCSKVQTPLSETRFGLYS